MKSIKILLPFICVPFLCGCGKVDEYVGVYRISYAVEEQWHYYWTKETKKSEKTLPGLGTVLYINKNKSVNYRLGNETKTGKIHCHKDYCTFSGLSMIDSSYHFTLKQVDDGKIITYFNRSKNVGFDYDFTKTTITMSEYLDPADFNNHIGTYTIYNSSYKKEHYVSGAKKDTTEEKDYLSLTNKQMTITADKTFKIDDEVKGTITFSNSKVTFIFNDGKSFLGNITMDELHRNSDKMIYLTGSKYNKESISTIEYNYHTYSLFMKR